MSTNWDEWGGVICQGCGEEVFRILEGKCNRCQQKGVRLSEADIENKAQLDALRKELSRSRRRQRSG